jgi:colanic acid biosynthesis glycosyl transferase WcaI
MLKSFVFAAESWLLRRFDGRLITISVQMRKRLIAKGVEPSRIGNRPQLVFCRPLCWQRRRETGAGSLAGDGPEKQRLMRDYARQRPFLAIAARGAALRTANLANLHVLPQSQGAADLVLPSKLGGMLASGKPVLATANPGTELYEVLDGTSILATAGDSAAVAAEIDRLVTEGAHPALGDGRRLAALFGRESCLEQFRAGLDPSKV